MIIKCVKCGTDVIDYCNSCFPVKKESMDMRYLVSEYDHKYLGEVTDRLHYSRFHMPETTTEDLLRHIKQFATLGESGVSIAERASVIGMLAARIYGFEKWKDKKNDF